MAWTEDRGRRSGAEPPWDGKTLRRPVAGQGPVVNGQISKGEGRRPPSDAGPGWFPTGDVATIDADGFMQITDRKDVIKSGGEWISSIDIENIAMATRHPDGGVCRYAAIQVGGTSDRGRGPWPRRGGDARRAAAPFTKAKRPSGRFPMTWCLSMPFRWGPPARCSRPKSRVAADHKLPGL